MLREVTADRSAQPPRTPAIARTWDAQVIYRECGVVTGIATYSVTLSRQTGELTATVDGKPAPLLEAARILKGATTLTLISEIIPTPAAIRALGVRA